MTLTAQPLETFVARVTTDRAQAHRIADALMEELDPETSAVSLFEDGTDWTVIDVDDSVSDAFTPVGIWGATPQEIYFAGGGIPHLYTLTAGSNWAGVDVPVIGHLKDVWGSSSSAVFAVGMQATVFHYNGQVWTSTEIGGMEGIPSPWLGGVFGFSPTDVYAVGSLGAIAHYDGSIWTLLTVPWE